MTAPRDARVAAEEVDRLLERLRSGPDPHASEVAEQLVTCLVQLYGAGLARVVESVGPERTRDLCADPLVESLLLVHDLHPLDPDTRIRRALDRARPRLGTPGPDLHHLGVDASGMARVRLTGRGHGCRSATQAVRAIIEDAVREAAPDTTGVEVEVVPPPPPLLQIGRRPATRV